jgi:hypothetical protein
VTRALFANGIGVPTYDAFGRHFYEGCHTDMGAIGTGKEYIHSILDCLRTLDEIQMRSAK